MISISQKGDFKKIDTFLEKCLEVGKLGFLDKYGREGVNALRNASPRDSGRMAESWSYKIEREGNRVSIVWYNSDIEGGCNVALLIQMGHATKAGGWVEGIDFINPALEPIFAKILDKVLKEVR